MLDTWFSSALWPFSTLGWPEKTQDLDYFYPTDVLVTGYDIIFFWVARMIFSGCEQTKQTPFHTVFIHGLVRDDQGRKMSKSLGNGIDPLEMAEKYGADALRFNLVTGNSPGNDMRFYTERCEAMRNFANKIWNASRFLMMNLTIEDNALPEKLELEDKWILSKLNTVIAEVTENMDHYELGVAAQKIYDFIWDTYCDWYIEMTKARLQGEDLAAKEQAQGLLDQWKAGDATADSFAALAKENSADETTKENGGLHEDANRDSLDAALTDWLFAQGRQVGDTTVVESTDSSGNVTGYQVLYVESFGEIQWKYQAASSLRSEDYNQWYEDLQAKYPAELTEEGKAIPTL